MGGKARKKKLASAFLCCRVKDLVNLLGISRSRLYSYIYIKKSQFPKPTKPDRCRLWLASELEVRSGEKAENRQWFTRRKKS